MLVVGAGFAGSVVARELAEAGFPVTLLERRAHVAGNAFDEFDDAGVQIHRYGPHIFHTNSDRIFDYLSRYTAWRPYEHRVLAEAGGRLLPIPINRTTINSLYGLDLDEDGVARFLESVRIPCEHPRTSEEVVLNSVGRELCDLFFRGYTRKQWGLDLSELSAGVAARIPTRTSEDDRYFTDTHQAMPADGYTRLFDRLLEHPGIDLRLNVSYDPAKVPVDVVHTVYTGPIDAFFGYRFGPLPYRSLKFEHEHLPATARFQPVGTVNFPNRHAFTRITEFRHLTGQLHSGTSIVREYPCAEGDPYYPIPRPCNEALFQRYRRLAQACPDVTFVGRLAEYRYYNMDQVVGAALAASAKLIGRFSFGSHEDKP